MNLEETFRPSTPDELLNLFINMRDMSQDGDKPTLVSYSFISGTTAQFLFKTSGGDKHIIECDPALMKKVMKVRKSKD